MMNSWLKTAMLVTWTATIYILVRRIPEEEPSDVTFIENNLVSNLILKIETVLSENERLKAAIFDEIRVLQDAAPGPKSITKEQPEDDLLWSGDKEARRAVYLLDNFWFYLRDKLELLSNITSRRQLKKSVDHMRKTADQYHWRIKHKLNNIQDGDGREKRKWDIMNELSQKVQRRFAYIQNPKNCRTSRKYICPLKSCGYGCQLHHMAYCLIMAYASNRTLVVNQLDKNSQSWTPFFKPLSETCLKSYDHNVVQWNELNISGEGDPDEAEVLLPVLDNIGFRPDYLPLAIPADLAQTLQRFHGNPIVWWIGQVAKYLTRFSDDTERDLKEYEKNIKFRGPIVGVHVRRTDKLIREAALHYLDEYMVYVEDYFNGLDIQTGSKVERKVYLATDEYTVIKESKKYKDYTFIYNIDIIKTAERVTGSSTVMMGIVYDIHFLSKTDFLVCTFSSQVCRAAYELMQTKHVDASSNFRSLDDIYYYGGQGPHRMTAVEDHEAQSKEELSIVKGSDVYIAGNTWTGDVVVRNHGETRNALVPAYKVDDIVETAQCPRYAEVDQDPVQQSSRKIKSS
ncbi:alpha-(1,6)-fucosyltransferase-like [Haliotis asinina]|uniref:alpha-(1,6)-fucosyltransferase-like n=1 Tax=Haliotis asinina TaxID=109174 RepID=UPI0035320463